MNKHQKYVIVSVVEMCVQTLCYTDEEKKDHLKTKNMLRSLECYFFLIL